MKSIIKICKNGWCIPIACFAFFSGAPAKADPGDLRHPVLIIDSRIFKVLEERVSSMKTETEVVDLLGKPDRREPSANGTVILGYRWALDPNARLRYENDKSRWYLSGISFWIDTKSGKVVSWSWNHMHVLGRNEGIKKLRENMDRDYEMLRSMADEDKEKAKKAHNE
jgi:hypothetical protein